MNLWARDRETYQGCRKLQNPCNKTESAKKHASKPSDGYRAFNCLALLQSFRNKNSTPVSDVGFGGFGSG